MKDNNEFVCSEIVSQSSASAFRGGDEHQVQDCGFDQGAGELIARVQNVTGQYDESLKLAIERKLAALAAEIVCLTTRANCKGVRMAYQAGTLQMLMCSSLATVGADGKVSYEKYDKWRNGYIRSIVRQRLNMPADAELDETKQAVIRLIRSIRRQLQKYINIAECGEAILRYDYAGIDGVLEVRYIIRDMSEYVDEGKAKRPQITPLLVREKLRAIEEKFPFPSPDELAGRETVKAMRQHTDAICTYYRLARAGINETVIRFPDVQAFAETARQSLEKKEAERIAATIATVDETQRSDELKRLLDRYAGNLDQGGNASTAPVGPMGRERIKAIVASLIRWHAEVNPDDDTYLAVMRENLEASELRILGEIVDRLRAVLERATDESSVQEGEVAG